MKPPRVVSWPARVTAVCMYGRVAGIRGKDSRCAQTTCPDDSHLTPLTATLGLTTSRLTGSFTSFETPTNRGA